MSNIYCGAKEPGKNQKRGTPTQCVEKSQIRQYGILKINKSMINAIQNRKADEKKVESDRRKIGLKLAALKGTATTNKGRYETTKNIEKKPEYYKKWQDAKEQYNKLQPKFVELSNQREAIMASKNNKDHDNNDSQDADSENESSNNFTNKQKHMLKIASTKGLISRYKRLISETTNKKKLDDYNTKLVKAEKQAKELIDELETIKS